MVENDNSGNVSRRLVMKGAAWSVPVVAAALAVPLAAASVGTDVGAFSLVGSCGVPDFQYPGFVLTAGPVELPTGTSVVIDGSGTPDVGVITTSGSPADVAVLSATSVAVTLTSPLAPGAALDIRTSLDTSFSFVFDAAASLPAGYDASGAKTSGSINSAPGVCTAA